MKRIILYFALFFTSISQAQITFEKGYLVTQSGDKKDVLIKNIDWVNSPENFIYKTDEFSAEQTGNTQNIKEFGIYGSDTYINYIGSIDESSKDLSDLSFKKEPELREVAVFLKLLVPGEKKLYSYRGKGGSITNYFYSNNKNNDIQLLIYKKYHTQGSNMLVATNEEYKNQLKTIFSDDTKLQKPISTVKYNENSLKKIFGYTNQSQNTVSPLAEGEYSDKKKRNKFNLNIRPGFNFYQEMKVTNLIGDQRLPSTANFRIGLEGEAVLPFNKNKWSVIFEPTYAIYTSKKISQPGINTFYNHNVTLEKYSFIEIAIGVRHYMYLNDKSKLFINAQINAVRIKSNKAKGINLEDREYIVSKAELANVQPFVNLIVGAGYNYNNRFSVELRYNSPGELAVRPDFQNATLHYFSAIFGYNIF